MSDFGTIAVLPKGSRRADIIFVGQSPGEREEIEGEPFVGPAGELLRGCAEDAGIQWKKIYRTNVFRRRLYQKDPDRVQALVRKHSHLTTELDFLHTVSPRPRVVVLLGNEAYYAIFREWGITTARGMHVSKGPFMYVLALHPSYILRKHNPNLRKTLVEDLILARQLAYGR